jgi:hypothetical protein
MIRALVAAAVLLAGCDKRKEPAPAPPVGSNAPIDLPETLSMDWQSLRYDLGSLGSVQAVHGRAEFTVVEDDTGILHASQDPHAEGTRGFLDLAKPALVDLDGDHHEEAVVPFELKSSSESVFGAFVLALRDGVPVTIGTLTTTHRPGFTIDGATIKTDDGVVWRWDAAQKRLISK